MNYCALFERRIGFIAASVGFITYAMVVLVQNDARVGVYGTIVVVTRKGLKNDRIMMYGFD